MNSHAEDVEYFKGIYKDVARLITNEIQKVGQIVAPTFDNGDLLKQESSRFVTEGGKRFRPTLAYIVAKNYAKVDIWPNLALEAFHKYILAHDDIIDQDGMRYGKPTIHAKMSQNFKMPGDANHFGKSLAIVAGDLIEAATYKIILTSNLDDSKKIALCKLMPEAMDEVGWGWYDQFLMDYESIDSPKVTFERIEKSIIWVTGKYTIKLPMLFGFTLAGQNAPTQLDDFVASAGLLFQAGDDLLGLFGSQQDTGKSNFGDIAQGKKTLPIWLAYKNADLAGKKLLKLHVGNKDITQSEAELVRQVIVQSGAIDKTKKLMQDYREKSLVLIEAMSIPADLKKFLRGFIYYIENRDR